MSLDTAKLSKLWVALMGQRVTRVAIELDSVRLLFETGELHVEGTWALYNGQGQMVDSDSPLASRDRFELWRVVWRQVETVNLVHEPLPCLRLSLEDGWQFTARASEGPYEDWGLTESKSWLICNGPKLTLFS